MRLFILFLTIIFAYSVQSQLFIDDFIEQSDTINNRNDKGKQGTWVFYDREDGIVQNIQTFRNDTLNGVSIWYWPKRSIVSDKGYYIDGKLEGYFLSYWQDGSLRGKVNYKDGYPHGISKSYSQNGKLMLNLKYKNGNIDSSYGGMYVDSNIVWDTKKPVRVDTVVNKKEYADWNKEVLIYHNNVLHEELDYYKGKLAKISYYNREGELIKRIIYSRKNTSKVEKILHFEDRKITCSIYFNKKGEVIRKEGDRCP